MSISHNMDKAKELKSNPFKIQNKMEKEQDIIQKMIDTVTKKEEASNVIEVLNQDFEGLLLKTKDPIQAWIRGTILKKLQFNNAGDLFLAKAAELGYVVESVSVNETYTPEDIALIAENAELAFWQSVTNELNQFKNDVTTTPFDSPEFSAACVKAVEEWINRNNNTIATTENIVNESVDISTAKCYITNTTDNDTQNLLDYLNVHNMEYQYLKDVFIFKDENTYNEAFKIPTHCKGGYLGTAIKNENILPNTNLMENNTIFNKVVAKYTLSDVLKSQLSNVVKNYDTDKEETIKAIAAITSDSEDNIKTLINENVEPVIEEQTDIITKNNNEKTFIDKNGKNPKINDFIKDEDNNIGKIKSFFNDSSNEPRMLVNFNSHTLELNPNSKFEIINPDEKLKKIFDNVSLNKLVEAVGYLHDTYTTEEEFFDYNEKFGIAKRLGFETAEDCWAANPYYYSSTNPDDMKIVEPTTTLENFKQQFMYNPNEVNPVKEQDENAIVEKPLDYNPRALKYMINDDTFLKFSYHNLGTNEEATDLDLIYNTYIKGDDAMLAKLKTYESYTASLKESVIESNPGFKRVF